MHGRSPRRAFACRVGELRFTQCRANAVGERASTSAVASVLWTVPTPHGVVSGSELGHGCPIELDIDSHRGASSTAVLLAVLNSCTVYWYAVPRGWDQLPATTIGLDRPTSTDRYLV